MFSIMVDSFALLQYNKMFMVYFNGQGCKAIHESCVYYRMFSGLLKQVSAFVPGTDMYSKRTPTNSGIS